MSALRSSFAALSRVARNLPASRPIVSIARHPVYSYVHLQPARGYAVASGLTNEAIETRVLDVIKSFEKVSPEKVTPAARFTDDLGLDSLDAVEIVMAVEEEFGIEIPDDEADAILTIQQAIDYIQKTPAAH